MTQEQDLPRSDEIQADAAFRENGGATVMTGVERCYPRLASPAKLGVDCLTFTVSLERLKQCLYNAWDNWDNPTDDPDFIKVKSDRLARLLSQRAELEMPSVWIKRGCIRLLDGKHRLYWFLKSGYTHVMIALDPLYPYDDVAKAIILYLTEQADSIPTSCHVPQRRK